ncbi:MAG: hypothetical protein NT080_05105 [Spirochaetes bacterium]|nr:hypothetical protein [Spirochaetota bacterium]
MDEDRIKYALSRARNELELSRIYRALSKRIHPDLAGGSGERFVSLNREYGTALAALKSGGGASVRPSPPRDDFDPYKVVREMGFPAVEDPRACIYLAINRYKNAGLYNRKVRSAPALRKRNAAILRTVLYWARIYDPAFVEIFLSWDRRRLEGLATTALHRAGSELRSRLDMAYSQFMEYQEFGRPMTAQLVRSNLDDALETIELYHLDRDGAKFFAQWLLAELDKPPCFVPEGGS